MLALLEVVVLTEFDEHGGDGGHVGPVDDVGDVRGRGDGEGVDPDPPLALRRRVQQRSLETDLSRIAEVVLNRNLVMKMWEP